MRRVRGLSRIYLSYNILPLFSTDASIYVSFSPSYKEPLRQIPIAIPSDDIQEIIGKLVGIIILLNNTKNRASNLVQNSYISSEFETLIDGCVYEIYFPQEMQEIPAISTLRNYVGRFNSINISDSWELYKKIDSTGIIDSINSLSLSKSEILRTIILS